MTARKALQELRDYFEQKRDLAQRTAFALATTSPGLAAEIAIYDHAMEMVDAYLASLEVSA